MSKYQGNVLRFSFRKNSFFTEKEIHSRINSIVITDSSDVHCFDLSTIVLTIVLNTLYKEKETRVFGKNIRTCKMSGKWQLLC